MKFFKTLSVVLFLFLSMGCEKDTENQDVNDTSIIQVKSLPIVFEKSTTLKNAELEVVFTCDDIVSYNGKTGEIIFKNQEQNETLSSILEKYDENLVFHQNAEILFSLKSKIVIDVESAIYNEPILHYSSVDGAGYYIRDGYPWGLPIDDASTERGGQAASVETERKTNSSKIQEGWLVFVNKLKQDGKYIEK